MYMYIFIYIYTKLNIYVLLFLSSSPKKKKHTCFTSSRASCYVLRRAFPSFSVLFRASQRYSSYSQLFRTIRASELPRALPSYLLLFSVLLNYSELFRALPLFQRFASVPPEILRAPAFSIALCYQYAFQRLPSLVLPELFGAFLFTLFYSLLFPRYYVLLTLFRAFPRLPS